MSDAKRYEEEKKKTKLTSSQVDCLVRKKINELGLTHYHVMVSAILWIRSFCIFLENKFKLKEFENLLTDFLSGKYVDVEFSSAKLFELISFIDGILNTYDIE